MTGAKAEIFQRGGQGDTTFHGAVVIITHTHTRAHTRKCAQIFPRSGFHGTKCPHIHKLAQHTRTVICPEPLHQHTLLHDLLIGHYVQLDIVVSQ